MAYMTVTKAIESGIDVIDCATSCFSNGTSQPATETMFYALQQYGIPTGLNEDVINKVNDFFKPVKADALKSGKIVICDRCTDCLREMESYEWVNDGSGHDVPRKENDHAMDEMRYFAMDLAGERSGGFAAISVVRKI